MFNITRHRREMKMAKVAQGGYSLAELLIALAISAVLGIYAVGKVANESEETLAIGSGVYLATVAGAANTHTLVNFNELSAGLDVPTTAQDLSPTVAELVASGRLNAGFPSGTGALPTRQTARIDIRRSNCPGPNCLLTALVCTTDAVTLGRPDVRFDLAQTMVDNMKGIGGQSLQTDPGTIRGPSLNTPNPLGAVAGVVCASAQVDTALYQQFVKIRDTRDPELQGNLSVAGNTNLTGPVTANSSVTVNGALSTQSANVNNCIRMQGDGRMAVNCMDPTDLPPGYGGGLRAFDVIASGTVAVTDSPGTFQQDGNRFTSMNVSGLATSGFMRSKDYVAADRMIPQGLYNPGSSCENPGALARNAASTAGLLLCANNIWTAMVTVASDGGSCSINGSGALDSVGRQLVCINNTWTQLDSLLQSATIGAACPHNGAIGYVRASTGAVNAAVCRANPGDATATARWFRLQDVTTNLVFVTSVEVTHGSQVAKPNCTAASGQTPIAISQLIPKTESTSDGGLNRYTLDGGTIWTVQLVNGSGGALTGNPSARALLQSYCYYP